MTRAAIYFRQMDPPSLHDRQIVERLLQTFQQVLILPRSNGPSQRNEGESLSIHRAAMLDLNFADLAGSRVAMGDLEGNQRNDLAARVARMQRDGAEEVSFVAALDELKGGPNHCKFLQDQPEAEQLWQQTHFTVLVEFGATLDPQLLPVHHSLLQIPLHVDSSGLRSLIFHRDRLEGLLFPPVATYIQRHGLFQGTPPSRESCLTFQEPPRLKLIVDERNPKAVALAKQLAPYEKPNPELMVTIGGDGTMLRAIRQYWRLRIPFYGLNEGHLGFLLNEPTKTEFWQQVMTVYQLPLLLVEATSEAGQLHRELAFNDMWVERATGQTAWIEVKVNEMVRMAKVVSDGMLVSTAAGSTSYARAMGATPVPFNTSVLILAGSNVLNPPFWRPAVLPLDSRIELKTLDIAKRPLKCFIDGVLIGPVNTVRVRTSRIAAVELAFTPGHDPTEKLALQQFP